MEDIAEAAEGEVGRQLAAAAIEFLRHVWKETKSSINRKAEMEYAVTEYIDRYMFRHAKVKALGMSRPMSLKTLFTNVRLAPPSYLQRLSNVSSLEQAYRRESSRRFSASTKGERDGIAVANQEQYLNVLGAPGAGKSTFLKRLGLCALEALDRDDKSPTQAQYSHAKLPVFLSMNEFDCDKEDVIDFLQQELEICGFGDLASSFAREALENGLFLLLFDGLDEVQKSSIDKTVKKIRDFLTLFPKNRFVTSCRTAFYRNHFPDFCDVVLTDFDERQISAFVKNWFSASGDLDRNIAEKLIDRITDPSHSAILELAGTPLLLTFICIVYDSTQKLPPNRSTLYERALRILLEEWAAEKRVHNSPVFDALTSDLEIEVLSELAQPAFEDDELFFDREKLTDFFDRWLANELHKPKDLKGSEILDAIEKQQGLLVQRASGIYSFSHLTIQEFLAARRLKEAPDLRFIGKHLVDDRWREVFLLMCGMGKADKYLNEMASCHRKLVKASEPVNQLFKWVAQNIGTQEGADTLLGVRSGALLFLASLCLSRIKAAQTGLRDIRSSRVERIRKMTDLYQSQLLNQIARVECDLRGIVDELCRLGSSLETPVEFENLVDLCMAIPWDIDFCVCHATGIEPESFEAEERASFIDSDEFHPKRREVLDVHGDLLYYENVAEEQKVSQEILECFGEWGRADILPFDQTEKLREEIEDLEEDASRIGPALWAIILHRFDIPEEFFEVFVDEAPLVLSVIKSAHRTVECKNAALSVSKGVWRDVAGDLLAFI